MSSGSDDDERLGLRFREPPELADTGFEGACSVMLTLTCVG